MTTDPEKIGLSLAEIAQAIGGEIAGDAQKRLKGVAPFETAGPEEITYAEQKSLLKRITETQAGAVIVPAGFEDPNRNLIRAPDPKLAFAKAIDLLDPLPEPIWGISPQAVIGRDFSHGEPVAIGPGVVIGDQVSIGTRTVLGPGVVLGDRVVIGDGVHIHPNVTILERCRIGNRVTIHANSVIGSEGFGFIPEGRGYYKMPQRGIVQIDDDVEIGAGNTIDRATFGRTWIQSGVKTDNLVHIAHNVTVGPDTLLVAQVGISGSVRIGRHAILAGQVGVSQHLEIGENVIIGPQSGIAKSIPANEIVTGSPGIPHKQFLRAIQTLPKLPEMLKRITALEKRLSKTEAGAPKK